VGYHQAIGTVRHQGIEPGQMGIHADRGPSMKSKTVALLMAELGVNRKDRFSCGGNFFSGTVASCREGA